MHWHRVVVTSAPEFWLNSDRTILELSPSDSGSAPWLALIAYPLSSINGSALLASSAGPWLMVSQFSSVAMAPHRLESKVVCRTAILVLVLSLQGNKVNDKMSTYGPCPAARGTCFWFWRCRWVGRYVESPSCSPSYRCRYHLESRHSVRVERGRSSSWSAGERLLLSFVSSNFVSSFGKPFHYSESGWTCLTRRWMPPCGRSDGGHSESSYWPSALPSAHPKPSHFYSSLQPVESWFPFRSTDRQYQLCSNCLPPW